MGSTPVSWHQADHHSHISRDHIHDAVLLDYCDAGQLWDPILSAYFYNFDPDTGELTHILLAPNNITEPSSNLTSFLHFSGIWGDFEYPYDHPSQKTVPYFGLRRYVSGPTGPTTKQLVRKGLAPDERASKSLLQWGVLVFMALYPYCFRGWRAWLSGIVFIGMSVCIIVGIKRTMKRLRSPRGFYRKIGAEEADIMLENWRFRDNPHID
jgi:hypothetical protein